MFVGAADGTFPVLWMHQNATEESRGQTVNIHHIASINSCSFMLIMPRSHWVGHNALMAVICTFVCLSVLLSHT